MSNPCGCNDTNDTTQQGCGCAAGLDAPITRFGTGVPAVQSDDTEGRLYIQTDSTPAGEVWYFNGESWTDLGFPMQGETGAAGAAGTSVEENTAGTTTAFSSVGLTTIATKVISLDTDGSYIDIENTASLTVGNANLRSRIMCGGVNVWENTPNVWGIAHQTVRVRVHRVNATTIQFQSWIALSNTFFMPIAVTALYNITTSGVADATSMTVTLEWGGDGTSQNFTITKFVK